MGLLELRKHISVVICTVSPFSEDADLSQVTPEIQHSSRFFSGTVRIYSQSVLHWLAFSSLSTSRTFLLLRASFPISSEEHSVSPAGAFDGDRGALTQIRAGCVWQWTSPPSFCRSLRGGREGLCLLTSLSQKSHGLLPDVTLSPKSCRVHSNVSPQCH